VKFNNAGVNKPMNFLDVTEDNWHFIMDVNGLGCMIGMQEAARQMIAQGGGGKIVEADETYHGRVDEPRKVRTSGEPYIKRGRKGPANKRPIVALVERGGREREVDEPGPGDSRKLGEQVVPLQVRDDRVGDVAGLGADLFGQRHGDVGLIVAEARVGGADDRIDVRVLGAEGVGDGVGEALGDVLLGIDHGVGMVSEKRLGVRRPGPGRIGRQDAKVRRRRVHHGGTEDTEGIH